MKNIQLELTIDDTNLILEALGALPFARVYTLIGRIQDRGRKQIEDDAASGQPVHHGNGNGHAGDREHAR